MALDPGWAAVLGAVAGSAITLAAAVYWRVRGQERRDEADLMDKLRGLDRRRVIYAQCLETARQNLATVIRARDYLRNVEKLSPEADARPAGGDVRGLSEQLSAAGPARAECRSQLDLIAPDSVRDAFDELSTVLDDMVSAVLGRLAEREFGGSLGSASEALLRRCETWTPEDARNRANALRDAMRTDLRIYEPSRSVSQRAWVWRGLSRPSR